MNATSFVIPVPPQASLPVVGDSKSFPVRRIWCVGRNYLEHIREMGNDERAPPSFFAKHADMIWSVPEIIAKLSEQVTLGAGDIIMTGAPAGVAALSPGERIECGVDGVGALKVTIGKPA